MKSIKELSIKKKVKDMFTKEKVVRFMKDNAVLGVQLGIMGLVIAFTQDASFAKDSGGTSGGLTVITNPLNTIRETITGPVAVGLSTVGIAMFGGSFIMNTDSQFTKNAMRLGGGGALALNGASLIDDVFSMVF